MTALRRGPTLALWICCSTLCSAQTGIFQAGSHHLYLHCEGQRHGPAVVLDAELYRDSSDWREVQPGVAQFTQVCSYDREGLGKSLVDKGVSPEAECADERVEDLHNLLKTAHVPPPYVLVGHSAGGPHVRRFTTGLPKRASVYQPSPHPAPQFEAINQRPHPTVRGREGRHLGSRPLISIS